MTLDGTLKLAGALLPVASGVLAILWRIYRRLGRVEVLLRVSLDPSRTPAPFAGPLSDLPPESPTNRVRLPLEKKP